jgi:hypothetical protein
MASIVATEAEKAARMLEMKLKWNDPFTCRGGW